MFNLPWRGPSFRLLGRISNFHVLDEEGVARALIPADTFSLDFDDSTREGMIYAHYSRLSGKF